MAYQALLILLTLSVLPGCASVHAPEMVGTVWTGKESVHIKAQIRYPSKTLPEGWLLKVSQNKAAGSFSYRKRSGNYNYSEAGYFTVDQQWRSENQYMGLLKAGNIFCVVNPDMQGDAVGTLVTTYKIYDYCTQLHSQ